MDFHLYSVRQTRDDHVRSWEVRPELYFIVNSIFIYSFNKANQQKIAVILLRNRCYYYHSMIFDTYSVRIVHRCSNCNRVQSDICNVLFRQ